MILTGADSGPGAGAACWITLISFMICDCCGAEEIGWMTLMICGAAWI